MAVVTWWGYVLSRSLVPKPLRANHNDLVEGHLDLQLQVHWLAVITLQSWRLQYQVNAHFSLAGLTISKRRNRLKDDIGQGSFAMFKVYVSLNDLIFQDVIVATEEGSEELEGMDLELAGESEGNIWFREGFSWDENLPL